MSLGSFMPFYLVHMLNEGMALRLLNYSEYLLIGSKSMMLGTFVDRQ